MIIKISSTWTKSSTVLALVPETKIDELYLLWVNEKPKRVEQNFANQA